MSADNSAPPRYLISLATHWGTRFGGINSFNTDLLRATGLISPPGIQVICVTLDCDAERIAEAAKGGVTIVSLDRPNDHYFLPALIPDIKERLKSIGCRPGADSLWLGHDLITGPIAVSAARECGGKVALVHHMSYCDYEAFAEDSQKAEGKEKEQRELFRRADVLFAVGPVLRDALADLTDEAVAMLIPGLAEVKVASAPNTFAAFLSGRVSADTARVKQAQLGLAGFSDAIRRAQDDTTLPEVLRSSQNPRLKIYGLRLEHGEVKDAQDTEHEFKKFSEEYAGRVINLSTLPFTTNRQELFGELRHSSVALMPSWHEGFGLTGWEAIAAGVPLILSKKSGVYRFLEEWKAGIYTSAVFPIDVRGSTTEPYFKPDDLSDVSTALIAVAKNGGAAKAKAAALREELLSEGYTWEGCARSLLLALGLEQAKVPSDLPLVVLPIAATETSPARSVAVETGLEIPKPRWSAVQGLSISQLLRAEEAVIPFDPKRKSFLDEQLAWAQNDEFRAAVRLLTGLGGTGKTRLALEMCRLLSASGWTCGFLPRASGDAASTTKVLSYLRSAQTPTLIILDYAETRVQDLVKLAAEVSATPPPNPIRILLLARSSGEWWERLPGLDQSTETLFLGRATSGPFELPPLYETIQDREAAFRSIAGRFGELLQIPPPLRIPDLSIDYYSQPLLIQMAAMMALQGEHAQSAEGVVRSLVNHERRYWKGLLDGDSRREDQAAQLMAIATLANGMQIPRPVEQIWVTAGCGTKGELTALFRSLAQLYPGRTGLEGLRPDLLGEALVTQVTLTTIGTSLLDGIFARSDTRVRHHAWTVFARILRHRLDILPILETVLSSRFARNLQEVMDVCCETTSALSDVVERAFSRLPRNEQLQFAPKIQNYCSGGLLPLDGLNKLACEATLAHALRKFEIPHGRLSHEDTAALASAFGGLALALSRLGRSEPAAAAAKEAETRWDALAKIDLKRFEPYYAGSLNSHANRLSELGRYEEAEAKAREALQIRQRLAQSKPERFEPDLATSLSNYASSLSELGRYEEAEAKAREALGIYQRLAQSNPEHFESDLATSLSNYAGFLSKLGRYEEAEAKAQEALQIRQRLAQSKPERFEPDLATSLSNYASSLNELGRYEESETKAQEALGIYQRLAQSKPERFEPDLATSLSNYANFLNELGHYEEAEAKAQEALGIYQRLAQSKPERFESDLAMSLSNYANSLSELGRYEEAEAKAQEALQIRQRLAQSNPERFEPDLATSLSNYAGFLSELGRYEEAEAKAQEALQIRQRLAQSNPERFEPDLATSLSNYANFLSELGHYEEAEAKAREALQIRQRLAQSKPERFEPDLATSLSNYANFLSELGHYEEAEAKAREALGIYQRLAQSNPERFEPALAMSLSNYASFLSELGRYEEAEREARQAVDAYTSAWVRFPRVYSTKRMLALLKASLSQWLVGRVVDMTGVKLDTLPPDDDQTKAIVFFSTALRSLSALDEVTRTKIAEEALTQWQALSQSAREGWRDLFFLTAAISEKGGGISSEMVRLQNDARVDYDQTLKRRQGRQPKWVLDAAQRLEVTLGTSSGAGVATLKKKEESSEEGRDQH